MIQLPTRSDLAAYRYRIDLDGVLFTLDFEHNSRTDLWSLGILNAEEIPLVMNVPIHVNYDLFSRFNRVALPPGRFLAYDTSGKFLPCRRADLGARVLLFYEEAT